MLLFKLLLIFTFSFSFPFYQLIFFFFLIKFSLTTNNKYLVYHRNEELENLVGPIILNSCNYYDQVVFH